MRARAALATLAVLVLAWVGVLLRDLYIAPDQVTGLPGLSRVQFEREIDRFKAAQLLNPDSSLQLSRARYYLARGRNGDALREAEALTRSEPANIIAWQVLYLAARKVEPRRGAVALATIRRLNPLGASGTR